MSQLVINVTSVTTKGFTFGSAYKCYLFALNALRQKKKWKLKLFALIVRWGTLHAFYITKYRWRWLGSYLVFITHIRFPQWLTVLYLCSEPVLISSQRCLVPILRHRWHKSAVDHETYGAITWCVALPPLRYTRPYAFDFKTSFFLPGWHIWSLYK